jgi:hypothetical protein
MTRPLLTAPGDCDTDKITAALIEASRRKNIIASNKQPHTFYLQCARFILAMDRINCIHTFTNR